MDEAERCTHIAFMSQGRITHTGTPEQVKALVPGTVLEVSAPAPRDAPRRLATASRVCSAHLLGDRVRLLVADGTPRTPSPPAYSPRAWGRP